MANRFGMLGPALALGGIILLLGCEGEPQPDPIARGALGVADGGAPRCPTGRGVFPCPHGCRALQVDPRNCGACGYECVAGEVCSLGACVVIAGAEAGLGDPGVWNERGPILGGRLDAVDVHPTGLGPRLMVGSPGGGAWRIWTGGGPPWSEPVNYALGDYSFVHFERDVTASSRLFGVTWNGLYATSDFGDNWTGLVGGSGIPGDLRPRQASYADPKPFGQLPFSSTRSAVFFGRPCAGFYYGFCDSGSCGTFTQHYPFLGGSPEPNNCLGNIAPDPVSGIVYISTLAIDASAPAQVYRSRCPWVYGGCAAFPDCAEPDDCLEFVDAFGTPGYMPPRILPTNTIVSALTSVSTGSFEDDLMALIFHDGATETWVTFDGGSTWWERSAFSTWGWAPRTLLYPGTEGAINEVFQGNVFSYHTTTLGLIWNNFSSVSADHVDTRAIDFDTGLERVYTVNDGAHSDGSKNNIVGYNWTPGSQPTGGVGIDEEGLSVWQAFFGAVVPPPHSDPEAPRRVLVGAMDNGLVCSNDANEGASGWMSVTLPSSGCASGGCTEYFAIAHAPSNPNRAYLRSCNSDRFYRSPNARNKCETITWEMVCPTGGPVSLPPYWTRNTIAVDPTDSEHVYFVLRGEIGVSINGGNHFTHESVPDLPTAIFVDEVMAGGPNTIYVGTESGGAYSSTTEGSIWTPWGLNSGSPPVILAIARSNETTPTWWMATTDGLYRKRPSDPDWSLSTGGGGYVVNDVEVDPCCPTQVYAALGLAPGRQQHRGGIRFSANNGGSWTSLTAGLALHQGPVADIEVDEVDPRRIYAASYGRGFWTYDWGGDPRGCTCP